jgi:hypothetical protein
MIILHPPPRPGRLSFQQKKNSKYHSGKNKASQGKVKKRVSGNGHGLPHFIAIIRVAIAEIRAAKAAIRPETATIHVAAFSFLSFSGSGGCFFLAISNNTVKIKSCKWLDFPEGEYYASFSMGCDSGARAFSAAPFRTNSALIRFSSFFNSISSSPSIIRWPVIRIL